MKKIKLLEIPNYKCSFTHNGQQYELQLNSRLGNTYLSYSIDNKPMIYNRVCLNGVLIDDAFLFHSKKSIDPYYTNFSDFELRLLK